MLLADPYGSTAEQPGDDEFTNHRRFESWRFWAGKNHSDYGD